MLPILFQSPELTLYSYPLLMGLGWGVAYQFFFSLIPPSYSQKHAQFIFWGLFIFGWLGSKLLFLLTLPGNSPQNLITQISFWTGGGFVFYGGLFGGLFFLLLCKLMGFTIDNNISWALLPALTFGHAIGRVGCFLAGCCFGRPTDWWWGIYLHEFKRHPTQILEAIMVMGLGFYLLKSKKAKSILLSHYLVAYGIIRFIIELLRGDEVRGAWGPLSPSEWLSLFLIVGGLIYRKSHESNGLPGSH